MSDGLDTEMIHARAARLRRRVARQLIACMPLVERWAGSPAGSAPSAEAAHESGAAPTRPTPVAEDRTRSASLRREPVAAAGPAAAPPPAPTPSSNQVGGIAPRSAVASANSDVETGPDESERRFAIRKQSRTSAVIVQPNGDRIKCTIYDISSAGARIHLPVDASSMSRSGDYVAPRFRLTMPVENVSFEAELAWRSGNRIGVRFVSPAVVDASKPRRKPAPAEKPPLKGFASALFRR